MMNLALWSTTRHIFYHLIGIISGCLISHLLMGVYDTLDVVGSSCHDNQITKG